MEKIYIKNRKGQKLAVVVRKKEDQKGLAFVMHGLGGFKEQDHIMIMVEAFQESGFTVITFDAANTIGESEGSFEEATITNYYEDLADVIQWSKIQPWYQEPFALAGHSLGGICTGLFAEEFPEKVLALAPVSTVVSGQLTLDAHIKYEPDMYHTWKETGWLEKESRSKPGVMKRLPWSHNEDRLRHDLIPQAQKLLMPLLLIVGSKDISTPPEHVQQLFDAAPQPKELHVIEDAPHTFRDQRELRHIKELFLDWIDSFEK